MKRERTQTQLTRHDDDGNTRFGNTRFGSTREGGTRFGRGRDKERSRDGATRLSLVSSEKDSLGRGLEPLFQLLVRVERDREGRRDAEKLYKQCCTEIERFQSRSKELGLTSEDAEDGLYAVVALLDELAVNEDGPLSDYWQPRLLQLRFFNENVAGEGFFDRLAKLRKSSRNAPVVRIFYLCLMFGFRGKYRLRGSELELLEIEDGVKGELQRARAIPSEIILSPSGRRPNDRGADVRRNQLLLSLATIAAVVSLLLYLSLRLALVHDTDQLVERVNAALGV